MIGAEADVPLLEGAGVQVSPDDRRPLYDEDTFETDVPGLYVAGSLARKQHIVNGRARAVKVVERIAEGLRARAVSAPGLTKRGLDRAGTIEP